MDQFFFLDNSIFDAWFSFNDEAIVMPNILKSYILCYQSITRWPESSQKRKLIVDHVLRLQDATFIQKMLSCRSYQMNIPKNVPRKSMWSKLAVQSLIFHENITLIKALDYSIYELLDIQLCDSSRYLHLYLSSDAKLLMRLWMYYPLWSKQGVIVPWATCLLEPAYSDILLRLVRSKFPRKQECPINLITTMEIARGTSRLLRKDQLRFLDIMFPFGAIELKNLVSTAPYVHKRQKNESIS